MLTKKRLCTRVDEHVAASGFRTPTGRLATKLRGMLTCVPWHVGIYPDPETSPIPRILTITDTQATPMSVHPPYGVFTCRATAYVRPHASLSRIDGVICRYDADLLPSEIAPPIYPTSDAPALPFSSERDASHTHRNYRHLRSHPRSLCATSDIMGSRSRM